MALATILVIMMIAVLAGIAMLKPFRRITESISAVTEGYDDNYLHENTYTETIELSEAFNKMSGRMKTLDDSKNEFVSNVSHELKTPLTSMKVLADSLLLQEDAPVELYKEFMGDMSEEIERENKIINDLLSLVKMDKTANNANTMNIKSENMNELVEKILKRLRPIAATRNIELVYESIRPVTAEVDEMKISLAISNLVENAIKYNKDNGWVHVTLNADHRTVILKWQIQESVFRQRRRNIYLKDSIVWINHIPGKSAGQGLDLQSHEVQWLCIAGQSKYSVSHLREQHLQSEFR